MSARASGPPADAPIGLALARTARAVSREFERALADAGGSVPIWQVLLLIRSGQCGTQSEMASELGITGATVTHHLNALESQGLVRRWREPGNRRVQQVELTDDGIAMFDRLRSVAMQHDARLRAPFSDQEVAVLAELLRRLRAAVGERAA